jgi:quinoprotein glucose dehydrogenase
LLIAWTATGALAQTDDAGGWAEYGGTLQGQRYSAARQITGSNVAQLRPAWVVHTHVFDRPSKQSNWKASSEATPVLWNGMLYFDTPFDQIFAVDAETGKVRWTYDPGVDRELPIDIVTSRGVSLWHAKEPGHGVCASDRVFVVTLDRRMIARDASTGEACLSFGAGGTVDLTQGVEVADRNYYEFTSPPTIVGDTVILGSSVGDNLAAFVASGAIRGFSAVTGRQRWSWDPVHWNTNQHPKLVGSGNAWSVISADVENDLVFVPTGSPSVDFYGGMRLGDNRDADSIVALRASTGERVWGFQLVHHDLWDYDTPPSRCSSAFAGRFQRWRLRPRRACCMSSIA